MVKLNSMQDSFSIINKTKSKIPNLPFLGIKEDVLGKQYFLSLAFIGKKKMRELNNQYRKINKPTNILSFLLYKNEGEILICPEVVKTQTKKFGKTYPELLQFLVIHGILHLKGMEHSSTMEVLENFYDTKYFHWHRSRFH